MQTYSFEEAVLTLKYGSLRITTDGSGLGDITVGGRAQRNVKTVAADGNVVFSKIKDRSGSLTLTVQQTSNIHKELIHWFNLIEDAPTSQWASISGTVKNRTTGEMMYLNGIAFTNIPDTAYGREVAEVQWSFDVADLDTTVQ